MLLTARAAPAAAAEKDAAAPRAAKRALAKCLAP